MYYSIYDVLDYITCPYKIKLRGQEVYSEDKTVSMALNHVYQGTYKYILSQSFVSGLPTFYKIDREFNKLWSEYRPLFKLKKTPNFMIKIHNHVMSLYNIVPEGYEVVALNYPARLSLEDYEITCEIDAVLYSEQNSHIKYLHGVPSEKIANTSYAAEIFAKYLEEACAHDFSSGDGVVKTTANLFNIGNLKKYRPLKGDLKKVIDPVVKSIQNSSFYPRPDRTACGVCPYAKKCEWSTK